MQKILSAFIFLLLALQFTIAQAAAPKPGEAAPPLKLTTVLQATGNLEQNIKSLQGQVVVLEFWATWCAPCIAAMPHLNELSAKYKGKSIQFISITDETDAKAKEFLKKKRINGWVGIDGDKAMHDAYEVQSIPFTVVIGSNGTVLGYPESKELSEEMLNKALAGQLLQEPTPLTVYTPPTATAIKAAQPLYELSLRPSASKGMANMVSTTHYKTTGAKALDILKIAFDATQKQVDVTATLPEENFDVVATNPGKDTPAWAWRDQLQGMLQDIWELNVRLEQREMEVYELVTTSAASKRLQAAGPEEKYSQQSFDKGILIGRNTGMATLAKNLQDVFGFPVLDATSLTGNYNYNLYYDEHKPESLLTFMEKEMGLTLRKVKRPVELLVVAPNK
ncbi:TIGR03435 family protein [Pontibacter sp. SGAir0037]|uniref:TIGR03435 family protein n=1 Tax=Pontibacter sp. SGAir0037 TaxID=2571030 RepID=UPI0010CD3B7C|nr:TIGR03435 family protein [Pontibacter sp. SGAir0037]QCR23880.1 hypothetical protein C1N53_17020 [Pontibacter sp. SGAir0037]